MLLANESEESTLDTEFDSDSELDDCTLLDAEKIFFFQIYCS
jgi:hypothetical protein